MGCIDCDEVLRTIEQYIDGEIPGDRQAILSRHLEHCSPCLHRAEFRARLKEIVRRKCRCETPEYLVMRIRTVIRSERRPSA